MPTFFLHLGMHKTGSTAFQTFLARNRDRLRAAGLAVPVLPHANHTAFLESRFGPHRAKVAAKHARRGWHVYRDRRAELRQRFDGFLAETASEGLDAVVSGEGASFLGRAGYRALRDRVLADFDRIVVVALVRPPLSFARSAASERLKAADCLATLLDRPPVPRFRDRFQPAIEVFGRENVRLSAFHPGRLKDDDVAQTLLSLMECNDPALADSRAERRNDRLAGAAAKFLSALNAALRERRWPRELPPPLERRLRRGPLARHVRAVVEGRTPHVKHCGLTTGPIVEIAGPRFRLPREIAQRVAAEAAADRDWIAAVIGEDLAALDDDDGRAAPALADLRAFEPAEIAALAKALDVLTEREWAGRGLAGIAGRLSTRLTDLVGDRLLPRWPQPLRKTTPPT